MPWTSLSLGPAVVVKRADSACSGRRALRVAVRFGFWVVAVGLGLGLGLFTGFSSVGSGGGMLTL